MTFIFRLGMWRVRKFADMGRKFARRHEVIRLIYSQTLVPSQLLPVELCAFVGTTVSEAVTTTTISGGDSGNITL